jgi:glycosyltransferase involved in cell wall biosynthesis
MACRILYVVGQLRAGGLERQLCYLLKSLDRERYRPAVAVWRFREDDFYVAQLRQTVVPLYFPPPGATGIGKLRWLRGLATQLRPEVIHSYSFYTNFGAGWATYGSGAVAVGAVQGDFDRARRDSGSWLGRLCARWPRSQIFNNLTAANSARGHHDLFSPRQVFVVRNGLDPQEFNSTPLPNGDRVTIAAVGSLAPVKRWDRLLTAATQLQHEGLNFLVRIVGDGPLRASLEQQADALGIRDSVEFTGQRRDVPALLSGASMLAHTSESEGVPNVVMEAMACGRPVVATDVGDTRYLVENGKTGFIVENGDDKAFARCLAMLVNSRELCAQMGAAGRVKAERDFGLDRLVEETLSAYRVAGWQDK